jgi:hypothetical protein
LLNIRQLLISICLLIIGITQLIYLHLQVRAFGLLSIATLLALLIVALPQLQLRERVLAAISMLLTIIASTHHETPANLFEQAGLQAAFLTAFMVLLSLLKDGAITSPSVLEVGNFLTTRSPGRRYLAIHCGSQLLGMVLNFGALTLLGPLIQRGARSVDTMNSALARWREQRQLSALTRGFSWTVAWSPATVSMAITISVVKDASLLVVCAYGVTAAAGSLLIGWTLDRHTGQLARLSLKRITDDTTGTNNNALQEQTVSGLPRAAVRRLGVVCFTLFALSAIIILLNDSRTVSALMLASPTVTALWIMAQHRQTRSDWAALQNRLRRIAVESVPAGTSEAITLACAGYIGVIVVALVNPQQVAEATGITGIAEPWLYLLAMAAIPLLSNLAMPPILTVTVLGGLFSTLPFEGISPDLFACALIWGWALNLTASPFGGVPLILGRITGLSSTRLSWHWNGVFSLLMFAWCSVWLAILVYLQNGV